MTTARGALFKFRTASRLFFVNNTLVAPTFGRDIMHHLLHGLVRNNLFIADGIQDREPWRARCKYVGEAKEHGYYTPDLTVQDWRSDWDYSGYDLNPMSDGESSAGLFHWFDESFERVEDLAMAAGIEMHGRQVERHATFVDYRPLPATDQPGSATATGSGSAPRWPRCRRGSTGAKSDGRFRRIGARSGCL